MKKNISRSLITFLAFLSLVAATALPAAEAKSKKREKDAAETSQEKAYWLTIKSGVRHNSGCRYYQNSNGRAATKSEGRACKICGG